MDATTNAVSSSSKLWAVRKYSRRNSFLFPSQPLFSLLFSASKEWVIPAKPKPGRKPKKDLNVVVNEEAEVGRFHPPPLHNLSLNERLCIVGRRRWPQE